MPFDEKGNYHLKDVPYRMNVTKPIYDRCKAVCEKDTRTQDSFEGMIRFFEDCGLNLQIYILKRME